jgi:phage terminase Nu1 subunit (DNA packaging protein)
MLNSNELKSQLGIDERTLRKLVREGLPFAKKGRVREYDLDACNAWLVAQGYAEQPHVETICQTYAELASELGMSGKDPIRVIAGWASMPGFPGRAGTQGRRDAHLPVDQIRDWLASRDNDLGSAVDDEMRELQRQEKRLRLEISQRDLQEQLGRLADVDEVAAFNRKVVADTVSILEPLADEVVSLLPRKIPAETRSEVHRAVTTLIDNALESIARVVEGDTDETDEAEQEAEVKPKRKSKGRKK